jgi:hypothetical protein
MFINKIDDLIDKIIDDFYISIIQTDKLFKKIFKEPNFVKYQQEINDIMINYIKTINLLEIQELVNNSEAINIITETIKRYIAIYIFLTIGFHYSNKDDTFLNNIVEFTKNQSGYNYKILNFFNSEGNALIVKYFLLIKNILTILNSEPSKIEILKTKPDYKEAIVFLNTIGSDYISKYFILDNIEDKNNALNEQCHNIIKTIIILQIYKIYEKKEFFRILEMSENLEGEYIFIDVVYPIKKNIDFSTVENMLDKKDVVKGLAYTLWEYLMTSYNNVNINELTNDDKINILINLGIIYPICDDLLLYHKGSEKYDKNIDPSQNKKKEDTKLRYIINKIDAATDLYNEAIKKDEKLLSNVKKQFYNPLNNRKAILVNNNEDIKIINKQLNQGKKSAENEEFFNDLIHYKLYPYINFKDFNTFGFSLPLNNTINVVRSVNFETGDFKQYNTHNTLQMRIGSKDTIVNIVGFIIPTNTTNLNCLKIREIIDIRTLSKTNKNGYALCLEYLKEILLGKKKHISSIYWLFDVNKDIVEQETYEQTNKSTLSDQAKSIASKLFDGVLTEIYYEILLDLEKKKNFSLQTGYHIINLYQKKFLQFDKKSDIYSDLENKIFNIITKQDVKDEYDKNEDIIHGLSEDVISLPKYEIKKNISIKTHVINMVDLDKENVITLDFVNGICQHNITWDKISKLYKTDPSKYSDELYTFIQQFVIENVEQDYVCKSCGNNLNIKKYVTDGVFDDETQRFITFGSNMDVPLEDIAEYEKFKISIRNLDKIIEKIANVSNIPHFIGMNNSVKTRRRFIIKEAIDILLMNNQKLKGNFKERNENASKLYGINRDFSNLFIFEFENSIFVFSSKDKDYYKPIKQNNVIAYLIILILLEINESQIMFMGTDKKGFCNFTVFDKVYQSLFSGLKFRKNNKGDLVQLVNYKMLCYIIYIISCSITKYSMWFYEYPDASKKKKMIPTIQKIIIHTVTDVLNSILELSATENIHHMYEVLSIKFYQKLNSLFSNEELYNRFKNGGRLALIENGNKTTINVDLKTLSGKYSETIYELPIRKPCRPPRFYSYLRTKVNSRQHNISNMTNCSNGKFHNWKTKGPLFECTLCNSTSNNLKYDNKETESIQKNFKYVRLQTLASKYCLKTGLTHQYVITLIKDKNESICKNCNNNENHEYSKSELDDIENILFVYKQKKEKEENILLKEIFDKQNEEKDYEQKVIENITSSYDSFISKKSSSKSDSETSSISNNYTYINELLGEIQAVIGNEAGVGTDVYLRENSYKIEHNHIGYPLDKPVIITDNDNKILYKSNHPFFKTDVIYYSSYKNGKVDTFYDATTKILLGYKEENKNIVLNKNIEMKIILNHSILNRIKLLGHLHQYNDITENYEKALLGRENIENIENTYHETITKNIIEDLMRTRLNNLKKIINDFQRIIYRIINNFQTTINENNESEYFANKLNILVSKYQKKLINITLQDTNGKHKIFKHWKAIVKNIVATQINKNDINFDFKTYKIINSESINNLDKSGNTILFYIISEFIKLLKYNKNKFLKADISYFIIDFINSSFDNFSQEKLLNNSDIKRFIYIINSDTYIKELVETASSITVGIYDEHIDAEEQQQNLMENVENEEDLKEEADAIDMDKETETGD